VEVIYEKALNFTNDTLLAYADISRQYAIGEGTPGFRAEYYNNTELKGDPIVQTESNLDHSWQEGEAVVENIRANNFSARYTTYYTSDKDGEITFEIEGDDGYKFLINDKEIYNSWLRNRWGARTYRQKIVRGQQYKIVVEYWQGEGKANIRLRAGNFERFNMNAFLNRIKDVDAIIYVGGISPQLEGEEMRVDFPGFKGGDRTSILLPQIQTDAMKALKSTGKPVVFVMMTGSAIAIPWESENIPAIINAWYGGQSAGTAIADVLFGDYNPAGRLPVTFYKSDNDLPGFSDYSMENRTYRYFKGQALYPFGFGLSYTTFKYDSLQIPTSVPSGETFRVTARLTNTGKMNGEEVMQLYISYQNSNGKAPIKALKGFHRINFKAGQSNLITFLLTPEDLSLVREDGTSYQPKGKLMISVGGGQPGIKNKTTSNVITGIVSIL
jgi:beta-glucosidase